MVALWLVDAALITMVQVATQRSQARRWAQFPCSMRKGPHSNNLFIVCVGGRLQRRVNEYPCLAVLLFGDLIDGCFVVGGCSIDYNGPGCNLERRWTQFLCSMIKDT